MDNKSIGVWLLRQQIWIGGYKKAKKTPFVFISILFVANQTKELLVIQFPTQPIMIVDSIKDANNFLWFVYNSFHAVFKTDVHAANSDP